MFDKLFQAQEKAKEVKERLDNISVFGEAEGGKVKVIATANKVVKSIQIEDDFRKNADIEEFEEVLAVAVNKAMEQAESVSQTEMQAMTQNMLGDLGPLGNLFGTGQ